MGRQQGDWVPNVNYGNLLTMVGGAGGTGVLNGTILVRHGLTSDTADTMSHPQVGVMEQSDDLMVHRVVGQIQLNDETDTEPSVQIAHLRIVKAIYDEDSNAFATFEDDLNTGDDANSPFLWERHISIRFGADTLNPIDADAPWSHIDVRVNRKLQRDEALVLLYQLQAPGTQHEVQMRVWVRSWVTRTR